MAAPVVTFYINTGTEGVPVWTQVDTSADWLYFCEANTTDWILDGLVRPMTGSYPAPEFWKGNKTIYKQGEQCDTFVIPSVVGQNANVFRVFFAGNPTISPPMIKAWDDATLTSATKSIFAGTATSSNTSLIKGTETTGGAPIQNWCNITTTGTMAETYNGAFDITNAGNWNTVLADSSGNIHIIYVGNNFLKHAYGTPGTVLTVETINGGVNCDYCHAVIDSLDTIHISYHDSTNGWLKYSYGTTGAWTTETAESVALTTLGQYTSICLDSAGDPHISHYDLTNTQLKHAYKNLGAWNSEVVDNTADCGMWSSIGITTGDVLHIAYFDNTNFDICHAYGTWGAWTLEDIEAVAGGVSRGCSIAIDGSDDVHVSYYKSTGTVLRYARKIGAGAWQVENVGAARVFTTNIKENNGTIHIAYIRSGAGPADEVAHAWGTWGAWNTEIIKNLSPNDCEYPAMNILNVYSIVYAYRRKPGNDGEYSLWSTVGQIAALCGNASYVECAAFAAANTDKIFTFGFYIPYDLIVIGKDNQFYLVCEYDY